MSGVDGVLGNLSLEEEESWQGQGVGVSQGKDNAVGSPEQNAEGSQGEDMADVGDLTTEVPPVRLEGLLLKRCRRNGDSRPWKLRYFVLRGSSLLYGSPDTAAGNGGVPLHALRLLVQVTPGATVSAILAPKGHAVTVVAGKVEVAVAATTETEQQAWVAALEAAIGLPHCPLASLIGEEGGAGPGTPSRTLRVKQAVAGAVAASRVGKSIIKRYMVEPARTLMTTVVAFAGAMDGAKQANQLERAMFDIAARIAVVVSSNSLPADLDRQTLVETTLDFCQDFLRHVCRPAPLPARLYAPCRSNAPRHGPLRCAATPRHPQP